MSDVVFQGNADFSSVEKAFQKMAKENLRLIQQVAKLAKVNNKSAAEDRRNRKQQAKLAAEANAIIERSRGPIGRYNAELAKLRDHNANNRISAKEFREEKQRLQSVLQQEVAKTQLVKGSYQQLEKELGDNVAKMKQLKIGTQEFDLQKRKVDQLRESLRNAKTAIESQEAPQRKINALMGKASNFAKSQVTQIGGMVASYLSVQTVLQGINYELAKKSRIEREAAQQTRTLDQAIVAALPNIAQEDRPRFREFVREEALRIGVAQKDYANVAGIAISAGAGDLTRAGQIIEELMAATAGDAESAIALGQAALDFSSLAGSENIEGAIGQMAAAMSVARAVKMEIYASAIAPAMASVTAGGNNVDGVSVERGLEVAGVINNLLRDTEGAKTATGLNQLFSKLESFVPQIGEREALEDQLLDARVVLGEHSPGTKAAQLQQAKIDDLVEELKAKSLTSLSPEQVDQFRQTRNFDARVDMLRANKTLADQFVDGLEEGKIKNALREFVQGTGRALKHDDKQKATIPSMDASVGAFENLKRHAMNESVALRSRNKSLAAEEYAATDPISGLIGTSTEIFTETIESVDLPGFDMVRERVMRDIVTLATNAFGDDKIAAQIQQLERVLPELNAGDAAKVEMKLDDLRALLATRKAREKELANQQAAKPPAVNVDVAAAAVVVTVDSPTVAVPPPNIDVKVDSPIVNVPPPDPAAPPNVRTDVAVDSPTVTVPPSNIDVKVDSPIVNVPPPDPAAAPNVRTDVAVDSPTVTVPPSNIDVKVDSPIVNAPPPDLAPAPNVRTDVAVDSPTVTVPPSNIDVKVDSPIVNAPAPDPAAPTDVRTDVTVNAPKTAIPSTDAPTPLIGVPVTKTPPKEDRTVSVSDTTAPPQPAPPLISLPKPGVPHNDSPSRAPADNRQRLPTEVRVSHDAIDLNTPLDRQPSTLPKPRRYNTPDDAAPVIPPPAAPIVNVDLSAAVDLLQQLVDGQSDIVDTERQRQTGAKASARYALQGEGR